MVMIYDEDAMKNIKTVDEAPSEIAQPPAAASAFDPANFGPVVLIQLMRLYDLQLAFLSSVDPVKAEQLVEMHAQGMTFCPHPMFAPVDNQPPQE